MYVIIRKFNVVLRHQSLKISANDLGSRLLCHRGTRSGKQFRSVGEALLIWSA